MFTCILAEKYKGIYFEFYVEILVGGNSVQILPNFPAKSLSIYIFCNYLIEIQLFNKNKTLVLDSNDFIDEWIKKWANNTELIDFY